MAGFPKTGRGRLLAGGGSLVVLGVVAFVLVYFVLFPTSAPRPFALTSTTAATSSGSATATQFAGRWTVATGSEAGYRVREKLTFLPAQSDAVGRTSAISGDLTFSGANNSLSITAASFTADVSKLKSDRSMRDDRIRTIGLQSDTYPTATFKLTSPIKLPADARSGQAGDLQATGILTIHGTSKKVTIPLELRLADSAVEVVGSLTFPWGEFGMTAPSVGGFVNVTGKATMEFDLHLRRA